MPIARVLADPGVLCVRSDSPYKSVKELLAAIKANPGKMKASGTGQGGIWHLAIAGLLKEQGIECARRTVAKYREALRIAPANLRKAL